MYEYINLNISDNIAFLSIKRPKALNALSKPIVNEIDSAVDLIAANPKVRAFVICSKDNFAAGADIKAMANISSTEAYSFAFTDTFNKIAMLKIPTIAGINGYALGGGLELALTCDIIFAEESAKMGFPEINLGIIPGAGGNVRLPRRVGIGKAKELIFTSKTFDAKYAERIGLINRVVEDGTVLTECKVLAKSLSDKSTSALCAAKRTISDCILLSDEVASTHHERDNWANLFGTPDQREGMSAFIEKRKTNYKGEK